MFLDFFYFLREHRLKVSISEWMTLLEALQKGLAKESLSQFYHLCRCLCVKHEADYDLYDQCFAAFFHDAQAPQKALDEFLEWLQDPILPRELTEEEVKRLESLDMDTLRQMFEERMKEQKERHDGGNRWIGTGGTSPFGHSGTHPSGIRVGGESKNRSAVQVASDRKFYNLRHDIVFNTRQMGLALRKLRQFSREGLPEELDLEESIEQTAKNAGEIELVFRAEKKNRVKLLLLMDVGGSMTPYTRISEQLFSAAHAATHFKEFKSYYFHNCVYETLYSDMARNEEMATEKILQQVNKTWFCIFVGDAAMSPYELMVPGGSSNYWHYNQESGLRWLQRIKEKIPNCIWLNPDPENYWKVTQSTVTIREVFEMFPLTLAGMEEGIQHLRKKRVR